MLCLWVWSSAGVAHHGYADLLEAVAVSTPACLAGWMFAGLRVVCLWFGCGFCSGFVGAQLC